MPGKRLGGVKWLVDLVVLSGGQLLSKVVGFMVFAYLARVLGPRAYGSAEYVIGLGAFFGLLVDFGLGPIGVRDLSKRERGIAILAANIPFARLWLAVLSAPTLLLVAYLAKDGKGEAGLALLFAISVLLVPWNADWLFQAREMMANAAVSQLLRMLVFAGVIFGLVKGADDLLFVGWAEVTAAVVTTLYYLFAQHWFVTPLSFRYSMAEAWALIKESASVGGSQLLTGINLFAPLFLVANLAGREDTAWFAASHRVIVSLSTFSTIYHFNLYPALTRRIDGPRAELDAVVRASFRVIAWVGIGGALVLALGADEFLSLAFGGRFAEAGPAFRVLVWFLPVTMLSGHARWLLIAAKRQRYVFFAQGCGALATVGIGAPLVARLHSVGGAAAMLAGSLGVWASAHIFATRELGHMPGLPLVALPAALALAAAVAARALNLGPYLAPVIFGSAYFAVALLVDRRLIPDFRHLARVKSDLTTPAPSA